MIETLRIGVLGLGRAAASMLPSLRAHPRVVITAAADRNPEALRRFVSDFGGRAFETIEAMCADGDVDAIYVATPHEWHVHGVTVAAKHRKHVIVEKPMALTIEDCRAMISVAADAGIVLLVGHTHAFDPAIVKMREIIVSGILGPLRMITNVVYSDFLYRPRRPEELDSSAGGGIMYNQVPHQIEIARALAGGPLRSAKAVSGAWDRERPTEGAMAALLEFEDGVAASLVYSGYDRFDTDEFHFWIDESGGAKSAHRHGSAKRALSSARASADEARLKTESGFAGRGVRARPDGPVYHPHFGMLLVSCERGDLRPSRNGVMLYEHDGVHEVPLAPGRAFPNKDNVIDEFYAAVALGMLPQHDGRWGLATVAAMLGLIQSWRERREIMIAPDAVYPLRAAPSLAH